MISLNCAVKFHGHLGPYLVLGLRSGDLALKKTKARKHFGIKVLVRGANKKPKSCLVDGLQLSTGATYGKGNIKKLEGRSIKILVHNLDNNKEIEISLKQSLQNDLDALKSHKDSEIFARKLLKTNYSDLFNLRMTKE